LNTQKKIKWDTNVHSNKKRSTYVLIQMKKKLGKKTKRADPKPSKEKQMK